MELLGRTLFSKSRKVLNVGGGTKSYLGPRYADFRQHVLDIDPRGKPDVCCNAVEMHKHVGAGTYDAVYCSHNLEHYYSHEVPLVLNGMFHVLKSGGWVEIRVPDILAALCKMEHEGLELEDTLYMSAGGPIATLDMIYGWRKEIQQSGNPFYAHKTAFSMKSLTRKLNEAGFIIKPDETSLMNLEIHMVAFKHKVGALSPNQ